MQRKRNISSPKIGMNRDNHSSYLQPTEYSLAVNANTENESGEKLNITNEPSNYLAAVFPTGFKVIGFKYNLPSDRTYFWLVNPSTGESSVGYIETKEITQENVDAYNICTDCSGYNELGTPLEEVTQLPFNNYVTLFDDIECGNEIGFDINYPIKNIEIKNEKGEVTAYWDDYKNPSRFAVLSDVSYLYKQIIPCYDDIQNSCIFVDKLLHFPNHTVMNIQAESVQVGGNLKLGTYEFWGTYCDVKGNNIVNYSTPTQPIKIFDENNNLLEQTDLDSFTNYAIRLTVNNLDTTFPYYKIVCVERTNVNNTQSAFVAGIYPTTDNTVLYTSSGTSNDDEFLYNGNASIKRIIDINELYQVRPNYETTKGTTSSGNILWKWGLKEKETLNLQPVVNIFSSLLKWQTSVAKESLFKNPVACSKFSGIMRNEVQPYAIRFFDLDGNYSSVFPFIGRPAVGDEKDIIDDINSQSLVTNTPNCTDSQPLQKWQVLNTATEINRFGGEEWTCNPNLEMVSTEPTPTQKSCEIEEVFIIGSGSATLTENISGYADLQTYLDENPDVVISGITEYVIDPYPSSHCIPNFDDENCDEPILIDNYNKIVDVEINVEEIIIGEKYVIYNLTPGDDFFNVGYTEQGKVFTATNTIPTTWTSTQLFLKKENATFQEKDINTYPKNVTPSFCNMYQKSTEDGEVIPHSSFMNSYMQCTGVDIEREKVYFREFSAVQNEVCSYAAPVVNNNITTQAGQSYFNNYYGDYDINNLLQPVAIYAGVTDTNFIDQLHKGALWFKVDKLGRDKIVFEITKNTNCSKPDGITSLASSIGNKLRYTIYDSCNGTPLYGDIYDTSDGVLEYLDVSTYPNTFYVAIDAPIIEEEIPLDCNFPLSTTTTYKIVPPCGCYTPYTRDVEYDSITVSWTNIYINKYEKYQANCVFQFPKLNDCDPVPFANGEFAYWESTENYPDNKELYDSSDIVFTVEHFDSIPSEEAFRFLNFYYDDFVDGQIILKNTDFRCTPIRHPKMPDNNISPFMSTESSTPFAEALIFPLGVTLDKSVVRMMLQVAFDNNLISQKQLENIAGYEILRGDNTVHKSILANGLGYDMYKYSRESKDYYYSNYPFNDLGEDELHYTDGTRSEYIKHPFNGEGNNKFTIISPDLALNAPTLGTQLVMSGYQIGNSRGQFPQVKDHPKWTILGKKGRDLAAYLGGLEAALELAISLAQTSEVFRVDGGFVWSFNAPGIGLAILQASSQLLATPLKYGQYRYQWIETFRNLGSQYNFASYNVGEGFYNSFLPNTDESEYIRGLSLAKYMKDGEYKYIDENIGKPLYVNNYLREASVLLSLGDESYNFNYDSNFKSYDTSRVIASQINCSPNEEYTKEVGSPYFTLKNSIPDQFGTIDSVKWLTTNYSFNINDFSDDCTTIFGGTVSISRFTWKKKIPLFKATAMGLPNKLAVEYSPYKNIGEPRFYCDYENDGEIKILSVLPMPDIDSSYNFDCKNEGFYIKPNSKFYLYYYGITNFLVESEINCNFRYGKREPKNQFYPQVGDLTEWTQEVNVPIKEPNTFYYNNVYSLPVSNSPYKFLDATYSKELWKQRANQENAVIYSEPDNSQNDIFDSWRVFKPLNWNEFDKKYGKLIGLKDLESSQLLVRFENGMLVLNAVDSLADRITPQNKALGTAGIFATRPKEFTRTDLGFAGTQNTDIVSTPYGHFSGDAKRGKIFMINQNAEGLETISESLGGKPTNMKNWFKENLPFKILKYFPNADIDNKFKGLGLNIWYDSKFDRVFFTKRDYIVKNNECTLKYEEGIGFYTDCVEEVISCSDGYTYNEETQLCEKTIQTQAICTEKIPFNFTNLALDTCGGSFVNFSGGSQSFAKCSYLLPIVLECGGSVSAGVIKYLVQDIQIGLGVYTFSDSANVDTSFNGNFVADNNISPELYPGLSPNSQVVITVVNGIITTITNFNDLPNCI